MHGPNAKKHEKSSHVKIKYKVLAEMPVHYFLFILCKDLNIVRKKVIQFTEF